MGVLFKIYEVTNVGLEAVKEVHHFAAFSRANTQFASNTRHGLDETRPVRLGDPHALMSKCPVATGVVCLPASLSNEHQIKQKKSQLHDETPKIPRKFVKNSPKTHQTRYC